MNDLVAWLITALNRVKIPYLVGLEWCREWVCLGFLMAATGSLQYQCVPNEVSRESIPLASTEPGTARFMCRKKNESSSERYTARQLGLSFRLILLMTELTSIRQVYSSLVVNQMVSRLWAMWRRWIRIELATLISEGEWGPGGDI